MHSQIARSFALFNVDEVVIYDEKVKAASTAMGGSDGGDAGLKKDSYLFLARILQYLETPQYVTNEIVLCYITDRKSN